jgi:hypothetical protein
MERKIRSDINKIIVKNDNFFIDISKIAKLIQKKYNPDITFSQIIEHQNTKIVYL